MDNELYPFSPITERPPVTWPGGARVAFYLGLNIEHYQVDKPSTSIFSGTAGLVPDPLNYGWRDYGPRVGFWRLQSLPADHQSGSGAGLGMAGPRAGQLHLPGRHDTR